MMRTRNKFLFFITLILFSFFLPQNLFSEETWTLAVQDFTYSKSQKTDSVTNAAAKMFPSRILENISSSLYRSIPEDEEIVRKRYKSKQDRAALFLQVSSAVKKRDNIVLGNYSEKELKEKIQAQENEIQKIRDKIQENIDELKKEEENFEDPQVKTENSEKNISSYLKNLKNLFTAEQNQNVNEQIVFYKDDINTVFKPSETAEKEGLVSKIFEKEIMTAGIDGLLTGSIVSYGDFISLTVDVYSFPGAKKIGTVTEFGILSEADFICSSLARQLVPIITNSLPINIEFSIEPEILKNKTSVYIDDIFYQSIPEQLTIESGVHRIEFVSAGYKNLSTTYYFEGNHSFNVKANMEEALEGNIFLNLKTPMEGSFFANGILQKEISTFQDENGKTHSDTAAIKINGKAILGEFISKDGNSGFFYVPEDILEKYNEFSIKINSFNKSDFIENQRKRMYFSYSMLVVSLIPTIWISGQAKNYSDYLSRSPNAAPDVVQKANIFSVGKIISSGISIGIGAWFVYELVKYFMAADTVLPVSIKSEKDFQYYENPNVKTENKSSENDKKQNSEENITKNDENIENLE